MTSSQRWVPRLLIGLAIVHVCYALGHSDYVWDTIAGEGFGATAVDHDLDDHYQREFTLWFTVAGGGMLFALGTLASYCLRETGRLPAQFAFYLIASGVIISVVEFPVTGGWAVLAIGVVAAFAARTPPAPRRTPLGGPRPRPEAARG